MKRVNNEYRIQLIKQAVLRRQSQTCSDPMARYIRERLANQPFLDNQVEQRQHFSGCHFDEDIGGWVSDIWSSSK